MVRKKPELLHAPPRIEGLEEVRRIYAALKDPEEKGSS
jgi:hypothetical protein